MTDILKTLRFFAIITIVFYLLARGSYLFLIYILPLIIIYKLVIKLLDFLKIKFKYNKKKSNNNKSSDDIIDGEFEDLD
tara:strand:+ start:2534 stop:2770 length:237 start_codon:yes stop_codon:yes gene_type:complete